MGIALILLGLAAAGLVVDFAVENWSATANDVSFSLFGGSFTATQVEVAIAAAVLGAVAIALCVLGAGLLRGSRGRRRTTKRRISELERENAELREHRTDEDVRVVHVDDRERVESTR
jgi:membrane protein implicated in regulation of membrane protease activity